MTLSDLWPSFQGHDNIQRPITQLIVSRVWSTQWFCFQLTYITRSRGYLQLLFIDGQCNAVIQGGTYTTVGQRITKRSTTCRLPMEALQVHDHRHLNFTDVRPVDSNFSNLPLGGAVQNYRVSVSNNGRDFGSSRTYTLYNSTCMSCSSSGPVQKVSL